MIYAVTEQMTFINLSNKNVNSSSPLISYLNRFAGL